MISLANRSHLLSLRIFEILISDEEKSFDSRRKMPYFSVFRSWDYHEVSGLGGLT
jgi:hypothetical protein